MPGGFPTKPVLDVGIDAGLLAQIRVIYGKICRGSWVFSTNIYCIYTYNIQFTYIYIYTYYNELVEILVEFFVEWAILKPTPTNCPTLYLDYI